MLCAAVLLMCGTGAAVAQDTETSSAASLRQACRADYHSYCTGDDPSLPIETACLRQHFLSLSSQCQSALGALDQQNGAESSDENSQ
jgi:hypothetical protein